MERDPHTVPQTAFLALRQGTLSPCTPVYEWISDAGLDKMKISVYTPNYERTDNSTERSSIG